MYITAIDTETTGLDLRRHQIIQLGVIKYKLEDCGDLRVLEKYQHNIRPTNIKAASEEALRINGYNEEAWRDSVPFIDCFPLLDNVFQTSEALIGQNLIFDLRFLKKEYWRYGLIMPKVPKYIDTKYMGQQLVNEGKIKSCSMDSMCKHFSIKFKGRAHTALTDCERTVTVWERLTKYTETKYFTFEEPYDAFKKNHSNAGNVI